MNKKIPHFMTKVVIVFLWLGVVLAFLYSGRFTDLFKSGKSINLLVWGQVLDKEYLLDFEKETGIQVNVNYFENNEELFVKLRSTKHHDYDLIMPSDWAAQLLIKEGIIKKIDHNKIDFLGNLYPALCNRYFDPGNQYTVPYYWTLYGLGVNTDHFNGALPPATWGLVFDERIMPRYIATFEDARPLVLIAALYLFGRLEKLGASEIEQIKSLLIMQKKHVEIYTDNRAEYVLASGVVPVVVGLSGDFLKVMRKFNNINFLIPQEGAFAIIDSLAITAATQKDDLIYPFLNYLFRKDVVKQYVDKFDFFPAVHIEVEYDERFAQFTQPSYELFNKVHFFKNVVSSHVLNDVLIALKS